MMDPFVVVKQAFRELEAEMEEEAIARMGIHPCVDGLWSDTPWAAVGWDGMGTGSIWMPFCSPSRLGPLRR